MERDPENVPGPESLVDTGVPGDAANGEAPRPGDAAALAAEDPDAVRRERDEFHELLLRKGAEFDNYRKRVERERREQAELAAADLIKDLLPLVDNLERALSAAGEGSTESYRRGVELIHRQLLEVLTRRGVVVIDPVGAAFDPHWHEAVVRDRAPDGREGEVLEVLGRGYRIGDRLLRPAMVRVASA